jgi:hypothetical protein
MRPENVIEIGEARDKVDLFLGRFDEVRKTFPVENTVGGRIR